MTIKAYQLYSLVFISVNLENDLARCYENNLNYWLKLCAEYHQSLLMMAAPGESMALNSLATGSQENLQQNTNILGIH